jgi:hypothetical protein
MLHNARTSPRRPKSSSPDSSVSDTSKHQVARCVRTLGIRRALPTVASTGVLRRIYDKDNRVLRTAELSQSLKVGTHSRARKGAGISTGSTKIGVTGSATLHGEAEVEPSEAATPGSQEICEAVLVRPANGSRHTGGRRWCSTKNTAGTQ